MKKIIVCVFVISLFISGCSSKHNKGEKISESISTRQGSLNKEANFLLNDGAKKLNSGNVNGAINDFRDLTKLYPNVEIGYYNLGLAYAKNDQVNEAIDAWEEFKSRDSNYADVYYNLGQAYKKVKKNRKAVENLSKYLSLRPKDPQANAIKKDISKLTEPTSGKGIIGRVSITDKVDLKNNIALKAKSLLEPSTQVIYSCIEFVSAPENTNIETRWYYRATDNKRIPVNSLKFNISGSKNVLISLKRPKTYWPKGKYEFVILLNKKENIIAPFNIQG